MKKMRILVAEDQDTTRERLCEALRDTGFDVTPARDGRDAIQILENEDVDLVLSDHRMPRMSGLELLREITRTRDIPVILYSAGASSDVVFRAGQFGAVRFLEYPFRIEEQLIPTISDALARRKPAAAVERRGVDRVVGASASTSQVRETIRRVARSSATVLITGETGTGKEVVARAIHDESGREPFCALAVTELAESLLEAELFGHEKGAFTGAVDTRTGLFEEADGGTLFLDEIGDAPASAQSKLLRVLETSEVRRVGASRSQKVDTRLIFATNRDLVVEVREGRFREDLYYRLTQAMIQLPPLRERIEDLEPLVRTFLAELSAKAQLPVPELDPDFIHILSTQPWRGNARELRAVLQRILLWWDGESPLGQVHLAEALVTTHPNLPAEERDMYQRMLEAYRRNGGNQEAARRELDLSRGAWRHRWNRYGLSFLGRPRP